MSVATFIVALGFTYVVEDPNVVLYSRTEAVAKILEKLSASTDAFSKTYVVLSGRGAVRKGFEEADTKKLANGLFEAKMMHEDLDKRFSAVVTPLGKRVLEDPFSTVTTENALFSFYHMLRVLKDLGHIPKDFDASKPHQTQADSKPIDLYLVSSHFHLVRVTYIFQLYYPAFKKTYLAPFGLYVPLLEGANFKKFSGAKKEDGVKAVNDFLSEGSFGSKAKNIKPGAHDLDFNVVAWDNYSLDKHYIGADAEGVTIGWETLMPGRIQDQADSIANAFWKNRETFYQTHGITKDDELEAYLKAILPQLRVVI